MNVSKAYRILSKKFPAHKVRSCLDYGDFFVFALVPMEIPDDEDYFFGTIVQAVDKKTGKIFEYDLTDDVDAYETAKSIEVETVFNKRL